MAGHSGRHSPNLLLSALNNVSKCAGLKLLRCGSCSSGRDGQNLIMSCCPRFKVYQPWKFHTYLSTQTHMHEQMNKSICTISPFRRWQIAQSVLPYSKKDLLCKLGNMLDISLHFSGHFPGEPGLAGNRMSPFRILLEIKMMEVMVTTGTIRYAMLQ